MSSRKALLVAAIFSVLVSSTVAPDVYAQASPGDEAFDPTDEDLKGEGLIGPPVFSKTDSSGSDIETISGSPTGYGSPTRFNAISGTGSFSASSNSWAPPSLPVWQHPAAQQFQEPLSNSRSTWNPIQQSGSSASAPPAVYQVGSNDEAWNLWLKMAGQQRQPSSPVPAYGAAAQIAGFGRNASLMPPGGDTDYVPVPPPQQVARGQWAPQPVPPPAGQWAPQPVPPLTGQWATGGQVAQSAWQGPIAPGVQQVPFNNQIPSNQTPTFNLSTSATQPGAQPPTQGDFVGGFMNWLGQMPNPFNQGQSGRQVGMPNLAGLQQAASSFSLPDMTPTDPNNPLSSPMASWVAGAIGSWVTQQVISSKPFQLGSALPSSMPASSRLPSLFPTDLKLEAKGESAPQSESQNILDSELADSLLSSNKLPTGSNGGSPTYSSRPTTFRGPLGIPVPGMLGNALASQRNKFALNYLLNRSLKVSGFGLRLR